MKNRYRWSIKGLAARGQTWETKGSTECIPGEFGGMLMVILGESFHQLTFGMAVYGKPGLGCNGPYRIQSVHIEMES